MNQHIDREKKKNCAGFNDGKMSRVGGTERDIMDDVCSIRRASEALQPHQSNRLDCVEELRPVLSSPQNAQA